MSYFLIIAVAITVPVGGWLDCTESVVLVGDSIAIGV